MGLIDKVKPEKWSKNVFILMLVIIVLLGVLWLGIYVTQIVDNTMTKNCDSKFGEGNWKLVEITGNYNEDFYKHNPIYIGQVWKCVEI